MIDDEYIRTLLSSFLREREVTQHEGEDVQCSICLADMHTGDDVTVLDCAHIFHPQCITSWLRRNNSCPLCRVLTSRIRTGNAIALTFVWNDIDIRTLWSGQQHTVADLFDFVSRLDGIGHIFQIQCGHLSFKNTEGYQTLKKTLVRSGIAGDMQFIVSNHPQVIVFDIT